MSDGSRGSVTSARHGVAAPRGQQLPPRSSGSRFGRMFAHLPARDPGTGALDALAGRIEALGLEQGDVENFDIPAGYTYLAQFVDHDLTFDPTSKIDRDNDPLALANFRTPRLDLDSVYGAGPADQPYLYDWRRGPHAGVKLLVGHNPQDERCLAEVDLPRNDQGRALIGDARNDENLVIAQLHLLFIQLHNKIVDRLCSERCDLSGPELFDEAQRLVRWHYQWVVTRDLLQKIVPWAFPDPYHGEAPTLRRRFYTPHGRPAIPVEFSAAAYRFGHSMVRPTYKVNRGKVAAILPTPGFSRDLGGFRRWPASLVIEWERFFAIGARPKPSMKINARLSSALFDLPPDGASLPRLNLHRGRALGLPAGRDVAHAIGTEPLTEEQLLLDELAPDDSRALMRATPLWFYVLCEAQALAGGKHLGPVGGTIVAEVLTGILEGDLSSYLRQWPTWTPRLPGEDEDPHFTMAKLVQFARPAQH